MVNLTSKHLQLVRASLAAQLGRCPINDPWRMTELVELLDMVDGALLMQAGVVPCDPWQAHDDLRYCQTRNELLKLYGVTQ